MTYIAEHYPIITNACIGITGLVFLSALAFIVYCLDCLRRIRNEEKFNNYEND
jgi:hypothetical protein